MSYEPITFCRVCGDPFDVYAAPEERICESCKETSMERKFIDVVFDGPPSHESGRFVEVEDQMGASIRVGEWIKRDTGFWVLRITPADFQ